jgi:hypothetical protein
MILLQAVIAQLVQQRGYGLDDRGSSVRFPAGAGNFSLHYRVQNGSDHSPPSSAEVNKAWSYTSTPQYVFVVWCLVKHRNKFTVTYLIPAYIQLTERGHLRNTPLEQLCTKPIDAVTVENIFGTSVVE